MGPRPVVVLEPDSQDALKVPAIEDQKPIETFPPGRANLALHVGIRHWCRDRSPDHGHAAGLENKVGATPVLVVVIVDQAASGRSVTANQITRLVASSIYKRT